MTRLEDQHYDENEEHGRNDISVAQLCHQLQADLMGSTLLFIVFSLWCSMKKFVIA